MAEFFQINRGAYSRPVGSADGFPMVPTGTRDGALFTADWKQSKVLEGRAYHVTVGALSTPIVGGGNGTIVDIDQPEFIVSVPNGTAILPLRVHVQCQTPLLATDADESEIILAVDRAAACAGDGTATAEVAYNMRTDNPRTSACTVTSAYTANVTDPVLALELGRAVITGDMNGTPANALWGALDLLYEPATCPVIMGPAMLVGYWGGTVATSGFAQVQWIEVAETDFS